MKRKFLNKIKCSSLFLCIFAISAGATYLSLSSNNNDSVKKEENNELPTVPTLDPKERLLANLQKEVTEGIHISFNEFSFSINEKNTIGISGDFNIYMPDPDSLSFNLSTIFDYNGKRENFDVSYYNKTIYLSIFDMNYSCDQEEMSKVVQTISDLIGNNSSNITGNNALDLKSLSTAFKDMNYQEYQNGYEYNFNILGSTIYLKGNSDCEIEEISIPSLTINNMVLSLKADFDIKENTEENIYNSINKDVNYLKISNSELLFNKFLNIINKKSSGINGYFTINGFDDNEILNLNLDCDFDIENKNYFVDFVLNNRNVPQKLSFALLPNNDSNNVACLNYNDVFNVKMNGDTIDSLITRIKNNFVDNGDPSIKSLFSFITNSSLFLEIRDGHYEGVLELINTIYSSDNNIYAELNMESLGFGENSLIKITLNGLEEKELVEIKLENLSLGNFGKLNGSLSTNEYAKKEIDFNKYNSLDNLDNIYDQIYNLTASKQANIKVSGSVYGNEYPGFDFSGSTQFDIMAKSGTGNIVINEKQIDGSVLKQHGLTIDVLGVDKMLFKYFDCNSKNEDGGLYGKFNITTLNDIIDLVKNLINYDNDQGTIDKGDGGRFSKFLEPIIEAFSQSLISQVIKGDYSILLDNNILESFNKNGNRTTIIINGKLLNLSNNIEIGIETDNDGTISSIFVPRYQLNNTYFYFNIEINDYVPGELSQLPLDHDYMDFSDIAILLQFGINTAKLQTYHLIGSADIRLAKVLGVVNINLDFYIYVNGKTVEVYGNIDANVAGSHRKNTFIYNKETIYLVRLEKGLFGKQYDYTRKIDSGYFLNHIYYYLFKDILGFDGILNEWIADSIINSVISNDSQNEPLTTIPYEDILKSFSFDKDNLKWDLTLDIGVLANSSALDDLSISVNGSGENSDAHLDSINGSMSILTSLVIVNFNAYFSDYNFVWDNTNDIKNSYDQYVLKYNSLSFDNRYGK